MKKSKILMFFGLLFLASNGLYSQVVKTTVTKQKLDGSQGCYEKIWVETCHYFYGGGKYCYKTWISTGLVCPTSSEEIQQEIQVGRKGNSYPGNNLSSSNSEITLGYLDKIKRALTGINKNE